MDSVDQESDARAKLFFREIAFFLPGVPCVVAANKQDLPEARPVDSLRKSMRFLAGLPVIPVSALEENLEKLEGINTGIDHEPFVVKYSDLDQNNHVNNVKYLQWILDSYPDNYCRQHLVKIFEINYLSETSLNDRIVIRTERMEDKDTIFLHSMFRVHDEKEICRARLTWH